MKMNEIAGQEKVDYTHCPNTIGAEHFLVMDFLVFFNDGYVQCGESYWKPNFVHSCFHTLNSSLSRFKP